VNKYNLIISNPAQDDLERLWDFLYEIDPATADRAFAAIQKAYDVLARFPHICRKVNDAELDSSWREMLINFGNSGYVALFEITDANTVTVMAVRHQRESDYH
jgi:plasmid stabilization system protein ParE